MKQPSSKKTSKSKSTKKAEPRAARLSGSEPSTTERDFSPLPLDDLPIVETQFDAEGFKR